MRVQFTEDFDYTPSAERRVTIAYKAGMELTVKREAGEAAVTAGAAQEIVPVDRPSQENSGPDGDDRTAAATNPVRGGVAVAKKAKAAT